MEETPDLAWHPIGEVLVARGLVRPEEVQLALEIQERTGQFLGEILLSQGLITPSDVAQALGDQYEGRIRRLRWEWEHSLEQPPEPKPREGVEGVPHRPLGQVLLDRGLITEDGLVRALREQKHTGMLLGEILVKRRWLSAEDIEHALAEQRRGRHDGEDGTAPVYEVRVTGTDEPVGRCSDFLEATDVAFEVLERRDPEELVIVKIERDTEERVWVYSRAAREVA